MAQRKNSQPENSEQERAKRKVKEKMSTRQIAMWYRFKESTVLREKMDVIIEAQEIH